MQFLLKMELSRWISFNQIWLQIRYEIRKQMQSGQSDFWSRLCEFMINISNLMGNSVLKYLWDHDLMNMLRISKKNMDEKVSKFLSLKAVGERVKKLM